MPSQAALKPADTLTVPVDVRLGVHDLIGQYAAIIDEDRLEEWPDLFTTDCFYKVTNRDMVARNLPHGAMYATSKGMLVDRISALREANVYEAQAYRHIVGPVHFTGYDAGEVRVQSNFLVMRIMHNGETTMFMTGVYEDRIDTSGPAYRFRSRVVVADSAVIDTLLAIPV